MRCVLQNLCWGLDTYDIDVTKRHKGWHHRSGCGCHVTPDAPCPARPVNRRKSCRRGPPGSPLLLLRGSLPTPPPSQAQPPSSTNLRAEGATGDPNTSHLHTRVPRGGQIIDCLAGASARAWPGHSGSIWREPHSRSSVSVDGQVTSPEGTLVTVTS